MRVGGRKVNDLYFTIDLELDLNLSGRGEGRKEGEERLMTSILLKIWSLTLISEVEVGE